jgi:hypothetical protein
MLGYHRAQRYAVRQTVMAGLRELHGEYAQVQLGIAELKDWMHIVQYTRVLPAPSLVVNEKLVCVGRFPSLNEVVGWLKEAIEK